MSLEIKSIQSLNKAPKDFIQRISEMGEYPYLFYSENEDFFVGIMNLMFTRAIAWDLNDHGFKNRFCYSNLNLANSEIEDWIDRGFDRKPPINWIATRGWLSPRLLRETYEHYYGENYGSYIKELCKKKTNNGNIFVPRDVIIESALNELNFDEASHLVSYVIASNQSYGAS